jgi:protein involved in polysaccharide export with SLBB domain
LIPPRSKTISVTGEVITPAFYELNTNNSVNSILKYAGGLTKHASNQVIISSLNRSNIYVSKDQWNKTFLMNGDSLIIPRKFNSQKTISLSLNDKPLVILPWIKSITYEIILNTLNVQIDDVKNVQLLRFSNQDRILKPINFNSLKNSALMPFDHLSIQLYQNLSPLNTVVVQGQINFPGTYPLINHEETLNSILSRSGGLQKSSNINNVVIKRDSLEFGSKNGEIVLFPNDSIVAMPKMGAVRVKGEVHNPGNIAWSSKNSTKDYLYFAGGLTAYADKKHIILITPYGEASKISNRSKIDVLPGSTIYVNEKPIVENKLTQDRFQQFSNIITSLISLAILSRTI